MTERTTGLMRLMALAGDYSDTDWTDPANTPPANARAFKSTRRSVLFELVGRASTNPDAAEVDLGALLVDAWLGYESRALRDPTNPVLGKVIRRGQSIVEASPTSSALLGRIRLVATDVTPGTVCRLHLELTAVGALTAVEVVLVEGGRLL